MGLPRWLMLLAAAACGVFGQRLAAWGTTRESFVAALAVFAVGGWLLARLGRDMPAGLSTGTAVAPVRAPVDVRSAVLLVAAAVLGALASLHQDITFSALQLVCYGGSLLAIFAFAYRADRSLRGAEGSVDDRVTRADFLLLAALTAIAFFFRLWRLDRVPALIWDDEILYLSNALGLLEEPLSPFA